MGVNVMKKTRNKGYILLTTIFMVVIVAVALDGLCRKYLDKTIQVHRQAENLQLRWGTLSITKALTPNIESLLQNAEAESNEPIFQQRHELTLGDCRFDIVIADEQAKFDVNQFYIKKGLRSTSQALRNIIYSRSLIPIIELTPTLEHEMQDEKSRPFTSYNRIFPDIEVTELLPILPDEPATMECITFFSNGRMNFLRAEEEVLSAYCEPELTNKDIQGLVKLRSEIPGISLSKAMSKLDLSAEKIKKAKALLTDKSSVHSILCTATAKNNRRWIEYTCITDPKIGTAGHEINRWAWQN